jgi:hypothetical protein
MDEKVKAAPTIWSCRAGSNPSSINDKSHPNRQADQSHLVVGVKIRALHQALQCQKACDLARQAKASGNGVIARGQPSDGVGSKITKRANS